MGEVNKYEGEPRSYGRPVLRVYGEVSRLTASGTSPQGENLEDPRDKRRP